MAPLYNELPVTKIEKIVGVYIVGKQREIVRMDGEAKKKKMVQEESNSPLFLPKNLETSPFFPCWGTEKEAWTLVEKFHLILCSSFLHRAFWKRRVKIPFLSDPFSSSFAIP